MSDRIGPLNFGEDEEPAFAGATHAYSDATAQLIDDEARSLLEEHRKRLDALVGVLLEKETVNEQEILRITGIQSADVPAISESRPALARAS